MTTGSLVVEIAGRKWGHHCANKMIADAIMHDRKTALSHLRAGLLFTMAAMKATGVCDADLAAFEDSAVAEFANRGKQWIERIRIWPRLENWPAELPG